jgi:hypothetical protein
VLKEVAYVFEGLRERRFAWGFGRKFCRSDKVPRCEEHKVVLGLASLCELSGWFVGLEVQADYFGYADFPSFKLTAGRDGPEQ